MTNDPLDAEEAPLWERGAERDPQFHNDRILNKWAEHLAAPGGVVPAYAAGVYGRLAPGHVCLAG